VFINVFSWWNHFKTGYTKQQPQMIEIRKEIGLMEGLRGVEGVVQILGVFDDSAQGYCKMFLCCSNTYLTLISVPGKNQKFRHSYPVIVMEMLDGGDLFQRISNRTKPVTEKHLAYSFLTFIKALQSVHEKGFIHRDLKLANAMNVSKDDAAAMKLIDFGCMVALPPNGVLHQPGTLCGTEGTTG
jgi:serine/threonine protein kinase